MMESPCSFFVYWSWLLFIRGSGGFSSRVSCVANPTKATFTLHEWTNKVGTTRNIQKLTIKTKSFLLFGFDWIFYTTYFECLKLRFAIWLILRSNIMMNTWVFNTRIVHEPETVILNFETFVTVNKILRFTYLSHEKLE